MVVRRYPVNQGTLSRPFLTIAVVAPSCPQLFALVCREVQALGGDVLRFSGGSIVALWLPSGDPDDTLESRARRATQAAMEVQTQRARLTDAEGHASSRAAPQPQRPNQPGHPQRPPQPPHPPVLERLVVAMGVGVGDASVLVLGAPCPRAAACPATCPAAGGAGVEAVSAKVRGGRGVGSRSHAAASARCAACMGLAGRWCGLGAGDAVSQAVAAARRGAASGQVVASFEVAMFPPT